MTTVESGLSHLELTLSERGGLKCVVGDLNPYNLVIPR